MGRRQVAEHLAVETGGGRRSGMEERCFEHQPRKQAKKAIFRAEDSRFWQPLFCADGPPDVPEEFLRVCPPDRSHVVFFQGGGPARAAFPSFSHDRACTSASP